jgi:hypothetical protein
MYRSGDPQLANETGTNNKSLGMCSLSFATKKQVPIVTNANTTFALGRLLNEILPSDSKSPHNLRRAICSAVGLASLNKLGQPTCWMRAVSDTQRKHRHAVPIDVCYQTRDTFHQLDVRKLSVRLDQ